MTVIAFILVGMVALGALVALPVVVGLFLLYWWLLVPLGCFVFGGFFGLLFGLGIDVILFFVWALFAGRKSQNLARPKPDGNRSP